MPWLLFEHWEFVDREFHTQSVHWSTLNNHFLYQTSQSGSVLSHKGFVSNRKSGDVQGPGHCCLQISAPAARLRTHQGEIPVAQIIILFVADGHFTIKSPVKTCTVKHHHINCVGCLASGDAASPSGIWRLPHERFTDFCCSQAVKYLVNNFFVGC